MLPVRFGKKELAAEELRSDRKTCRRVGPCGLGRKAMYLNTFFLDRRLYVCYEDIERIYKRIAMSAGGFSGRGVFGAIPYLVVELKDGRSRQCNFKVEEDVDALMRWIRENHPEIHLYTKQAEERLRTEALEEKAREKKHLSPSAAAGKTHLEEDLAFLEKHPEISDRLRRTVREKRRIDHIPASSRAVMGAVALAGIAGIALGLYALFSGKSYGLWGILFGAAFVFYASASRILPLGANTPSSAEASWKEAVRAARDCISEKKDFFLPAQYADPVVIRRMIRAMRMGRAESMEEALDVIKEDLKALNSSVRVSQEEHDEVAAIKPLFLECGYENDLPW